MQAAGEDAAAGGRGERRPVVIRYRRPPDRIQEFHQEVVVERDGVVVTLAADMSWPRPLRIEGEVALETGSSVVWFTFPGLWHDIGRFHRADGTLTGIYANVLTPVELGARPEPADGPWSEPWVWDTTDLFLDLWVPPEEEPLILDAEELAEAQSRGWVDEDTAERARREARSMQEAARAGQWPPPIVERWTLDAAIRALEA